jgi:hypothetical protein
MIEGGGFGVEDQQGGRAGGRGHLGNLCRGAISKGGWNGSDNDVPAGVS